MFRLINSDCHCMMKILLSLYDEDTAGRGASSSDLFVVSCSESLSRISERLMSQL